MKKLLIFLITVYQKIISPLLHQLLGQKNLCRHEISCSEFAKEKINMHGVIVGGKLAIIRIMHCQPFAVNYV